MQCPSLNVSSSSPPRPPVPHARVTPWSRLSGKCTPILKRLFLLAPNMATPTLPTAVTSHQKQSSFLPNTQPPPSLASVLSYLDFIFSLKNTALASPSSPGFSLSLLSPKRLLSTRESTSRPWTHLVRLHSSQATVPCLLPTLLAGLPAFWNLPPARAPSLPPGLLHKAVTAQKCKPESGTFLLNLTGF